MSGSLEGSEILPPASSGLRGNADELETKSWYLEYYRKHGSGRNDLLENAEVLYQTFAFDQATIRALRGLQLDRSEARVLDVGCGSGGSLLQLLRLGFRARNLSGIDINGERIAAAIRELPAVDFQVGSADQMNYGDGSFDVVFESTMFVQLTDEILARRIAREMIRVARPGGLIVIADWRYGKPLNSNYRAVSTSRITRLFGVGKETVFVRRKRGALVPPIGRTLSRYAPPLYFFIHFLLPPLVGQTTTVLRRVE